MTFGLRPLDLQYLRSQDWWKDVQIGEPDACWPWLKSTS
jgi:hypothetical protein